MACNGNMTDELKIMRKEAAVVYLKRSLGHDVVCPVRGSNRVVLKCRS
jgi:hypothetical protein